MHLEYVLYRPLFPIKLAVIHLKRASETPRRLMPLGVALHNLESLIREYLWFNVLPGPVS